MSTQTQKKPEDQPMSEVSQRRGGAGTMEEAKREPFGLDIFRDFDEWTKSIFEDYTRLDQEMDRRFREFRERMMVDQKKQIEQFKKEFESKPQAIKSEQLKAAAPSGEVATRPEAGQVAPITHHSYTKENRKVETRALQLGDYRILYKYIDQTKEKDGVVLPHVVRHIECQPAAPISLLKENALFEEELDAGKRDKILKQFEEDTKAVPEYQKPHRILKYVNSIITEDPSNKEAGKTYALKVVYLNKDNDRLRYFYKKRQGEKSPQVSIDRSTKLFSSFFF